MPLSARDDGWMMGMPPSTGFGKIFRETPLDLPQEQPKKAVGSVVVPIKPIVQTVAGDDLMGMPFREPRWAVPDLVPEGLSLLAGKPKCGKSWLVLDLALSIASGAHALGNIKCDQGPVLYLALEDTLRRLQGRMRAVLQGKPAPHDVAITTEWKRSDEGGLSDLQSWLSDHPRARLVVIDTLQKIRSSRKRDAGIYEDDYKVIGDLKKIADEFTVPILVVHHLNKDGGQSDPFMKVSGTAGITGSADTILVLEREAADKNATLHVKGRDINEAELAIQFDNESGKWLKLGKADDWRISEERKAIIRMLIDEGPMHPKEIAYAMGKKGVTIRSTLSRMARNGDITKLGDGRYSP